MRCLLASSIVCGCLAPWGSGAAHAANVADQLTVGRTSGASGSPRTGFLADRITGMNVASDAVAITYTASATIDSGAPAPFGSPFKDRGGTIFRASVGLDWQISSRWALTAAANGSPPSTTSTATTIPFQDANGVSAPLAGDLHVRAASVGGELSAEYDSDDALPIELVFAATGGVVDYATTQRIAKLQLADNTVVSASTLQQQCQTTGCSPQLQTALAAESPGVVQGYGLFDAMVVGHRVDAGVAVTGYGYSSDPTQLGYFGVASFGRSPATSDGTPFAPLRLAVRPHVLLKMGRFRLGASGEYDRYVDGLGSSVVVSAKPGYDLTSTVRAWVTLCLQVDEAQGEVWRTLSGAVGVRWTY